MYVVWHYHDEKQRFFLALIQALRLFVVPHLALTTIFFEHYCHTLSIFYHLLSKMVLQQK